MHIRNGTSDILLAQLLSEWQGTLMQLSGEVLPAYHVLTIQQLPVQLLIGDIRSGIDLKCSGACIDYNVLHILACM